MRLRLLIAILSLCSHHLMTQAQDDVLYHQPFESGHVRSNSSEIFNSDQKKMDRIMSFPLVGGQDDFDDTNAGDNPGGFNDPAPVESNLALMFLLSIVYFIWEVRQKKRIFNNINNNKV